MCLRLPLNIIFILSTVKKANELSFCSRFKISVLIVSTLAFVFKIIRSIIFSAVKKVSLHSQGTFLQSRNFSTVKKLLHSQGNFPQSGKFSTVVEIFHRCGIFHKFFSLIKEVFHKQRFLHSHRKIKER